MELTRVSFEKIFFHVDKLHGFLTTGDCYPLHIVAGLTDYCNHDCVWCYSAYSTHDNILLDVDGTTYINIKKAKKDLIIDTGVFLQCMSDAKDKGLASVSLVGSGEPILHPDFCKILHSLKELGIDIGVYSNGYKMNDEQIESIVDCCTFFRFSIDAADKEAYLKIHRRDADLDKTLNNMRRLIEYKKEKETEFPTIGAQYVTSQLNLNGVINFAKLMKNIGAQYVEYKPMSKNPINVDRVGQEMTLEEVLPLLREAKKIEDEYFTVYTKEEQFKRNLSRNIGKNAGYNNKENYNECYGHRFAPTIHSNGNMYLCVNLGGRKDSLLGNIYDNSLEEIWESEQRKKVIAGIDLCNKCPAACRQDPLNKILWDITHPDPEIHPNFL